MSRAPAVVLAGLVCALVVLLAAGCGDDDTGTTTLGTTAPGTTRPADARRPPAAESSIVAALAATSGGGFVSGELSSGIVRRHERPDENATAVPGGRVVARLDVGTGGQRGLVGLAAADDGRLWAARVAPGRAGRLVVERIAPGPVRRVWTGPVATTLATGGHLVHDADDDRLVIGVGDLQEPSRIDDPIAPNGKLLALGPSGPADQTPGVLSLGWNNPFAFDRAPDGSLLVVDNAPGREPERIARGDTGGAPPGEVTELPGKIAASGVVALAPDDLLVCGVVSGRLDRFRRTAGRWKRIAVLDRDCRYGVERLQDGRLVVSSVRGLRLLDPAPEG